MHHYLAWSNGHDFSSVRVWAGSSLSMTSFSGRVRPRGARADSWCRSWSPRCRRMVSRNTRMQKRFVLVLEGDYLSSAQGAAGNGRAPLLIYNPPGTTHRDRFRSDTGRFLTVAVSLSAQRGLEDVLTMPDYACVAGHSALQTALQLVRADDDELSLESHCVELMTAMASHYERVCERVPPWLLRARDCLREEMANTTGLTDIARDCGVHPVYLARAFRAHFGCSPGAYQRRSRLNRAAAMLTGDHASVADIALACGYFDQAHFSRTFREAFGLPPGHYRRRHQSAGSSSGSVRTRHQQQRHAQ